MAHSTAKIHNDAAYELDKAKAVDPNLAYSARANAMLAAAGNYVASTYHGVMAAMTENSTKLEDASTEHAEKEAEYTAKGNVDELERKNISAPAGERIAAGAREAGDKMAAKYHEGMASAEGSI
jgi:hypothetical protein